MTFPIELTLLRHGRSRADDEDVHEGRYDSPLTETGRAQVQARAAQWQAAGAHFDGIIASSLQRAQETARIIGSALNAPVEIDSDWMEFDNRPLAGLPFAEAEQHYPRPAFRNPYDAFHGVGESEWDFHSRAARAVQSVVRRESGVYLVVAHGGILNAALRGILGVPLPINESGAWFAFGDTGYARLGYRPEKHVWVLRELNPFPAESK